MPLPQTLLGKLKTRQVVPFVGAGVSMAVKDKANGNALFPSWGQLLGAAEQKLRDDGKTEPADFVRALLEDRDYLGAAKWAEDGLKGQLPALIREQVGRARRNVQEDSLDLARLIWELGSSLIITTNYDRVLEWACPHQEDCKRLINRSGYELTDLQRGGSTSETVWHLHGHVEDADSIVLTPESYARLYATAKGGSEWQAALDTLRHIMVAKSLLFIGYGMGDIQIIEQLQQTGAIFGGAPGPHYILATNEVARRIRAKGLPVEPITYETHGEPLLALLREMIKATGLDDSRPNVSSSPPISPVPPIGGQGVFSTLPRQKDIRKGPIKILFLASNPTGTGHLALDIESRDIEAKLRSAQYRNIELISKWAVRPDDLLDYFNHHHASIVHFSGHGSSSDEIILEDLNGNAKPVSKRALTNLFQVFNSDGNIRVVVLNACYSRPQAEAITQHVDCAIGMNKAISDEAARLFAASFYRAIGFGKSVQNAFEQGVLALRLEGIPEDLTPELLVREGVNASQIVLVNPLDSQ
ncbi:hypothetical protein IAD21_00805 [Abditibacteriota bacterium]|nr:hypothetical protein IAD21_00805 [Abditibacteriota bacterium]